MTGPAHDFRFSGTIRGVEGIDGAIATLARDLRETADEIDAWSAEQGYVEDIKIEPLTAEAAPG